MATAPQLSTMQCVEMAVFNLAGLTGTFQILNGASQQPGTGAIGLQYDIKILKIYNDGANGITLSYGVSGALTPGTLINQDYLPSKGTMIIDLQANHARAANEGTLNGRQGQLIYGKGTASADGTNLYIIGYL